MTASGPVRLQSLVQSCRALGTHRATLLFNFFRAHFYPFTKTLKFWTLHSIHVLVCFLFL